MKRLMIIFFLLLPIIDCFGQELNKYETADKSIFKIIAYDYNDNTIRQGSGVFISNNGIGISNYHVLDNVDSAYIVTNNGDICGITKIIDYNTKYDLVKFTVNLTVTVPAIISQNLVNRGDDVFALGYPCGLDVSGGSTLSKGIVSANRSIDDVDYIQSSAQITHGSSGGGLFDNNGKLIGITQGTFATNLDDVHANLYKIIPIKYVSSLTRKINKRLSEFKLYNTNSELASFEINVKNENFLMAEILILKMLESNIMDPGLWNKYGMILGKHELDKRDLAFKCFQNAIKLDPFYIRYQSNYAICLSEYSLNDVAIRMLDIASSNNSILDAHYYYAMGYCLAGKKEFDNATFYLKKSIELYNKEILNRNHINNELLLKSSYELAYCLKNLNKYSEALNICSNIIYFFPDYYTMYLLRAQLYYYLDDLDKACNDLSIVEMNASTIYRVRAIRDKEIICR